MQRDRSGTKARTNRAPRRGKKRLRGITEEDLLRLQFVADPQISPDGETIVFVRKRVGKKNRLVTSLFVVGARRGKPRAFTSGEKDRQPRWSPDGRTIAFVGEREERGPQIHLIAAAGGEASALTSLPEGDLGAIKWSPGGDRIAFLFRERAAAWTEAAAKEREENGQSAPPRITEDLWYRLDGDGYFGAQRFALYLLDVASGAHRKVYARDALGDIGFDFSPDGRKLVLSTNRDRQALTRPWRDELLIYDIEKGRTSRLEDLPEGPKKIPAWSPDGRWIAYCGRTGRDGAYSTANLELFVCDPAGGAPRSLTEHEDYCLLAVTVSDIAEADFVPKVLWSADSRTLYTRIGWHGEGHIAAVDLQRGGVRMLTEGPLEHQLGTVSRTGTTLAALVSSAKRPPEVYAGSVGAHSLGLEPRTDFNGPVLDGIALSPPRRRWVRSTGGTRVELWSMRPIGYRAGRRYPAVLHVHGGPHAQYGVTFFHEFQLLAASGYVVFFSNPRGSKGYGQAFCEAIRGAWGTVDWDDIQAVTRRIQSEKYVDSKRVGIMGGSYGGYMTNWAVSHSRDYAAAITDRSVANLVSQLGTVDVCYRPGEYWPGNTWDQADVLWEQSPLKYFGAVATPTLILHSEGDLRCSIAEAQQIFSALKLRGVPARFVRYPINSSHGMSRAGPPDLRIHRLREILAWWRRYLRR